MAEVEVPLAGGNVAAKVVRVGTTVRKPVTVATPAVEAVLRHLQRVGFAGAPRALGRDGQDRQVLAPSSPPAGARGPTSTSTTRYPQRQAQPDQGGSP